MILPALTEATSPFWRPIKYSLFPPLGLATLAAYLGDDADVEIQDEHVEALNLNDTPDLVVIQVYITSAHRAYRLADYYRGRGAYVALGGLHVTSLPDEAAAHADTIFVGPGEDTWPRFLADLRRGCPERVYRSQVRTLAGLPRIRRDLIKRRLYLVPNSIVVSRGCRAAISKGGQSEDLEELAARIEENHKKYPAPSVAVGLLQNLNIAKARLRTGLTDSHSALQVLERMLTIEHGAALKHAVRAR